MFRANMGLTVSKNEDVHWKLIEEMAVLLNVDEGVVLQLDRVGTRIWLNIDGKKNGHDLAAVITTDFDVQTERAEKDVRKFLKRLLKDEAIQLGNRGV